VHHRGVGGEDAPPHEGVERHRGRNPNATRERSASLAPSRRVPGHPEQGAGRRGSANLSAERAQVGSWLALPFNSRVPG
jgi:hypothetical protein